MLLHPEPDTSRLIATARNRLLRRCLDAGRVMFEAGLSFWGKGGQP